MDSYPDSVKRVQPPKTTMPNTLAALPSSQYATPLELVSGKLEAFFNRDWTVRIPPDGAKLEAHLLHVHAAMLFDLTGDGAFRVQVLANCNVLL